MTSTLTVIGLVAHVKSSERTVHGEAMYREKITGQNHRFLFKQFVNARHEYNEAFREGDLVLFGGKFTIDEQKLMLVVEMACVMEPKMGPNGEHLKWDPTQIPSTKPFINISTSAEEPLTTYENMNFVKTRSLVYSPFHSSARNINFELGYSKDAKWLESINDKWSDYANFFVGGFLEAIYTANSKTYAQVDAKMIDYDARFRHPNYQFPISSPKKSANAFAMRRNELISNPISNPRMDSIIIDDNTQELNPNKKKSIIIDDDDESATQSALSDLCNDLDDDLNLNDSDDDAANNLDDSPFKLDVNKVRGGKGSRGRRGRKSNKK
ncbi:unnamed protein product [Rhizophagus irregularis]|uniref:Uncharacterized protein n=1 Tax=Rhizophagus irregularis TaxID=588596 RepID=A0A915Z144_9GLOM|nr:unnamed protein product [Rhizophagus irregularis]